MSDPGAAPGADRSPEVMEVIADRIARRTRTRYEAALTALRDAAGVSAAPRSAGVAIGVAGQSSQTFNSMHYLEAGVSAAPSGWQPIESAPKDGTNVLLGWPKIVLGGYWSDWRGRKCWVTARGEYHGAFAPTHWMPLPDPPTPASASPQEDR